MAGCEAQTLTSVQCRFPLSPHPSYHVYSTDHSDVPDSDDVDGAGLSEVDGGAAAEENEKVGPDDLGRKSSARVPEPGPRAEVGHPEDLIELVRHLSEVAGTRLQRRIFSAIGSNYGRQSFWSKDNLPKQRIAESRIKA